MTRTASEIVDHITSGENFINAARECMPRLEHLIPADPKLRTEWLRGNTTLSETVINDDGVDSHVIVLEELTRICRTWARLGHQRDGKINRGYSLPRHISSLKFLRLELDLLNAAEKRDGRSNKWGVQVSKTETWQ